MATSNQPPPTKLPPPPRVILRRMEPGPLLSRLLVIIFGFGGAFFVGREFLYWQVCITGTAVKANIDDKTTQLRSSRQGTYSVYCLHYGYTYAGRKVSDWQEVPASAYDSCRVGGQLPAHVTSIGSWDFSELDVPRLDGDWMPALIGAFFGSFAIFVMVSEPRKRRLLREGTAVAGEIIDLRANRGRYATHVAKYRFTTGDGKNWEREHWIQRGTYKTLSIGTPVTVVYDPIDPSRSLPYELCELYECMPTRK